jgi:dolichol-phosphate mannosyltransferase
LVLLAYNEEAGLAANLRAIAALGIPDVEVVVVDDGSTDGTQAIVREAKEWMRLDVLTHETNRGVAAAFDTGLRHAAAVSAPEDFVITMEGDGTSDLATLRPMISLLAQGNDVVIASRYVAGGAYEGFPLSRHFFSLAANLVMRWYCGASAARDYTIFYRGYRAAVVQEAIHYYGKGFIEAQGFFANIEILVKLRRLRPLRLAETPLVYRYGTKLSRSKMRVARNIAEYLRFFVRDSRRRRPAAAGRRGADR